MYAVHAWLQKAEGMVQCYLNCINDKWELGLQTPEEAVEVAQGKM